MEDINQNYEQLRRLLVKLGYPHPVDKERICSGITTELLPLLHYGLLSHSKALATFISNAGYSLYRQNDLKFTEGIYKLLRKEFEYNPVLQCNQFLTDKGYAKRKIQFVVTCLKLGISKHNELIKQQKLKSQSKVSWNKTNLAKKVDKVIKKTNNNKSVNNTSSSKKVAPKITKKKMIIKQTPKAIIPKKIPIETPIDDEEEEEEDPLNDSLTVDEIRSDLPKPITITAPQQTQQPVMTQTAGQETDDEDKGHEIEEKAMELTNEELSTPQHPEEEDAVNQSIQIPQHKYDMQLIPEYDPNKYSNTMNEAEHDDGKNVNQDTTAQHYNESYLDAYSTLMDIPQTYLQAENQGHVEEVNTAHSSQVYEEEQPPKIMVVSDRAQNMNNSEDAQRTESDEDEQDEDDEDDMEQQQEEEEEDEDAVDNDGNEEEEEKGSSSDSSSTTSSTKGRKTEDTNKSLMDFISKQLDSIRQEMKEQNDKILARLDLMDLRIKYLEKQQGIQPQSQQDIKEDDINGHSLPSQISSNDSRSKSKIRKYAPERPISSTINVHKSSATASGIGSQSPSFPMSEHKSMESTAEPPHQQNANVNGTIASFTESTIGSSSLPVSLPMSATKSNNNHKQRHKHIHPATISRPIASTINLNYPSNLYPVQSPFLSSMTSNSKPSQYGVTGSMYSTNNAMTAVMKYPLSHTTGSSISSDHKSNGNGHHGMRRMDIPHIHTPSTIHTTESNGDSQQSKSDPDNTMEFIADLKRMLMNTDALLKSNRDRNSLYDNNI